MINKFLKKVSIGLMALTLIGSIVVKPIIASAKTNDIVNVMQKAGINAGINSETLARLESEYGITFIEKKYDNRISVINDQELKFKSLEEFESFLANLKNNENQILELEMSIETENKARAAKNINWYAPFSGWGLTGIACWKNVTVDYNYKYVSGRPQFTSTSVNTSYLTGINITTWNQTASSVSYSKKYSTNDTANYKVLGYYLLGVDINGFTIGLKKNDTWNCSLTLIP